MGRLLVWEPEKYTGAERRAAASTLIQAQNVIWRQDRNEFGAGHSEAVHKAYVRAHNLLESVREVLYAEDFVPDYPPSAS